jgi:hypothetical protein
MRPTPGRGVRRGVRRPELFIAADAESLVEVATGAEDVGDFAQDNGAGADVAEAFVDLGSSPPSSARPFLRPRFASLAFPQGSKSRHTLAGQFSYTFRG